MEFLSLRRGFNSKLGQRERRRERLEPSCWCDDPGVLPFHHELRVRYNECDPQGVVFNANFLLYFDIACTEAWRGILGGAGYADLLGSHSVDAVVAEANVKYLAPVRFDEAVTVTVESVDLGRTSMTWHLAITRDGERVTEGWVRNVFISPKDWKPVEMPDVVRAALS
jgi:acyl-CoA thioester hydrolase